MPSISQEEISNYWEIFQQQNPTNGRLTGAQMMGVLQNSQLPSSQLEKVWDLSDIDGDGQMDFEEFCIAMRLVFDQLKNPSGAIPSELPQWLIPASKQHLLEAKLALAGKSPSSGAASSSSDDEDLTLRNDFDWYIGPADRRQYETIYSSNCDSRGSVSFEDLAELYASLPKVPATDVSSAWNLVNPRSEEKIDKEQCIVFLHILNQREKGFRLPRSVPASLRSTFRKERIEYDVTGPQAQSRPSGSSTSTSSSAGNSNSGKNGSSTFAEGYMSRLGLGGRSQGYQSNGTDFSSTKDLDWEEVRLKRELADLEAKLEKTKNQQSQGKSSGVVRRELQLLLEYKESQLKKPSGGIDLNSAREEVDMVAEQLTALKEHYTRKQDELASLKKELEAL